MKIDNGGNSFFVFVKIYLCNKFLFNELVFYFFVNGNSAYFMNVGQNFGTNLSVWAAEKVRVSVLPPSSLEIKGI